MFIYYAVLNDSFVQFLFARLFLISCYRLKHIVKMADNLAPGEDGKFCVYLWGFKDMSINEIRDTFNEFGEVASIKRVNDSHFVRYTHREEAIKAIDAFANNRNVKVAPGAQRKNRTEENKVNPNSGQDHDGAIRSNRNSNNQGDLKSLAYDRQVEDKMIGNKNGHSEGNIRKHRNYNQENNNGERNFQDRNNKDGPRNNGQYYDDTMRSNRRSNNQGGLKSPPYDRQVEDKMTYKRNVNSEGVVRKHRNHNQENDKGIRNFQDWNENRVDRNEQSWNTNKHRNGQRLLNDHNEPSENHDRRRGDDFRLNSFSNQDSAASALDSNIQGKHRYSNSYSNNIDGSEKRWSQTRAIGNNQENNNRYGSGRSHTCKEVSDQTEQTYIAGNKIGHKSTKDNVSQLQVAKEVIIADLPREIMQADLYKLCDFVNPLHIDIHKIKGDDIVYAHVFVRTDEDVNMLVEDLNGKMLCQKKMVVMSVDKVLCN